MPRCRHILDSRRVKGGELGRLADLAREVQMGSAFHALDRDDVGQSGIGFQMAADYVEKIDETAVFQLLRYVEPVLFREATFNNLVGGVSDTEQEVGTDALAHGCQNVERELHPVVQRAAVRRIQCVRE